MVYFKIPLMSCTTGTDKSVGLLKQTFKFKIIIFKSIVFKIISFSKCPSTEIAAATVHLLADKNI